MTDESTIAPEEPSAGPVAGQRLEKARLAREISIHDIAKELHLDEPKVRALEQNEFDSLGAPVFAKGYLRKYAELVGVPADDVLADYHRFERSTGLLPIIGTGRRPPSDLSPGPWLAALLVIAVLAGGAWFWKSGGVERLLEGRLPVTPAPLAEEGSPPETSETGGPAPDVAAQAPPEVEPPAGGDLQPRAAEPQMPGAGAGEEPVARAPGQTDAGIRGQLELTLLFSGDCWTEVSDANGERLYFGLGTDGRTVSVAGMPPLHVLLGDSQYATVMVDGADYPIPASARRGETARLTLTGR